MVEKLFSKTDINLVLHVYHLYWDVFIGEMKIYPDAALFLQQCLLKKCLIVLVTDMTAEIQFKKIIQLDIEKYLQFIVTSDEAGIEKPDVFIFKYAIEKFLAESVEVKNIIVIGDDGIKDNFISSQYNVVNYHLIK